MKKLFNKIKALPKKIYLYYKNDKANIVRHLLIIGLAIVAMIYKWLLIVYIAALLLAFIYFKYQQSKFLNYTEGNGIIYGLRGKGKGLLLNFKIRSQKNVPFCNVPYGRAEVMTDISDYLESISPNNIDNFVKDDVIIVPKREQYEGRNVFIDDVNVYFPNWADHLIKKNYDSMPSMLAINRHLYNNYMIITTQSKDRPYKILRELQGDFAVKAIATYGWQFLWRCVPVLNHFAMTKYIYYENVESGDKLPFNGKSVITEATKSAYITAGQATKEEYEALHGKIFYGRVLQAKVNIEYDTRYFHQLVYGRRSPDYIEQRPKAKKFKLRRKAQHKKVLKNKDGTA